MARLRAKASSSTAPQNARSIMFDRRHASTARLVPKVQKYRQRRALASKLRLLADEALDWSYFPRCLSKKRAISSNATLAHFSVRATTQAMGIPVPWVHTAWVNRLRTAAWLDPELSLILPVLCSTTL